MRESRKDMERQENIYILFIYLGGKVFLPENLIKRYFKKSDQEFNRILIWLSYYRYLNIWDDLRHRRSFFPLNNFVSCWNKHFYVAKLNRMEMRGKSCFFHKRSSLRMAKAHMGRSWRK